MINQKTIQIKKAGETENKILTEIAFEAKRHWNYPEEYYQTWQDELTVSKEYISENKVFTVYYHDQIVGFYSIVENKKDFYSGNVFVEKGFWLEHIFIKPAFHNQGIGRILLDHAKQVSRKLGISGLLIFVDPNAKGFYDKTGAMFLYNSQSSIPDREIPVYILTT